LGMSRRTIYTGIGELEAMGNEDHPPTASPWRCQAHPPSWRRKTWWRWADGSGGVCGRPSTRRTPPSGIRSSTVCFVILRHCILWWDRNQHMNMVRYQVPLLVQDPAPTFRN